MTLPVDLTAAEEARLIAAAKQGGVAPAVFLKKIVNSLPISLRQDETPVSLEQTRVAAIRAAHGSLAQAGAAIQDLHRERQSDKQNEEREASGFHP